MATPKLSARAKAIIAEAGRNGIYWTGHSVSVVGRLAAAGIRLNPHQANALVEHWKEKGLYSPHEPHGSAEEARVNLVRSRAWQAVAADKAKHQAEVSPRKFVLDTGAGIIGKGINTVVRDNAFRAVSDMHRESFIDRSRKPKPRSVKVPFPNAEKYPDPIEAAANFIPGYYEANTVKNVGKLANKFFKKGVVETLKKDYPEVLQDVADVIIGGTAHAARSATHAAERAARSSRPVEAAATEARPSAVLRPGMRVQDKTGIRGTVARVAPGEVHIKSGQGVYKLSDQQLLERRIVPTALQPKSTPVRPQSPANARPQPRPAQTVPRAVPPAAPVSEFEALHPDVEAEVAAVKARQKVERDNLRTNPNIPYDDKQRQLKAMGMQHSAEVRQVTGRLTAKELKKTGMTHAQAAEAARQRLAARAGREPVDLSAQRPGESGKIQIGGLGDLFKRRADTGAGASGAPLEPRSNQYGGSEFEQDVRNQQATGYPSPYDLMPRGPMAQYEPGTLEHTLQQELLKGTDVKKALERVGVQWDNPSHAELMKDLTQHGEGYGEWYNREIPSIMNALPEHIRNHPATRREVTGLATIMSAGRSPFIARVKAAGVMQSVRKMAKQGLFDPNNPETRKLVFEDQKNFINGYKDHLPPGMKVEPASEDQVRQAMELYNGFSSTSESATKTPNYWQNLWFGSHGLEGFGSVPDRWEAVAMGAPRYVRGIPPKEQRALSILGENASSLAGVPPAVGQADRWRVIKEIGDTRGIAREPMEYTGGSVGAGEPITIGGRGRGGAGNILHPETDEGMSVSGKFMGNIEEVFQGVKDRVNAGVPEGQAVADAFAEAKSRGLLSSPEEMKAILDKQMRTNEELSKPFFDELHQYGPEPAVSPEAERGYRKPGDPFEISTERTAQKRQQILEGSPTIRVATTRGEHPNIDSSVKMHIDRMRAAGYDENTGTIAPLRDAGIPHYISSPIDHGGWEGSHDTSFTVHILGGNAETAERAGAILGKYFGNQDAVVVGLPKLLQKSGAVNQTGFLLRKPDGSPWTPNERARVAEVFNQYGIDPDTVLSDNGSSALRLPFFGGDRNDAEAFFNNVQKGLNEVEAKTGQRLQVDQNRRYEYLLGHPSDITGTEYGSEGVTGSLERLGMRGGYEGLPNAFPDEEIQPWSGSRPTPSETVSGGVEGGLFTGPQGPFAGMDFKNNTPEMNVRERYARIAENVDKMVQGIGGNLGSGLGALGGGPDPQAMKEIAEDFVAIGRHYVQEGTRSFDQFSTQLLEEAKSIHPDLAEAIRPHLSAIWKGALQEAQREAMDPRTATELGRLRRQDVEAPAWAGVDPEDLAPGRMIEKLNLDPQGTQSVLAALQRIQSDPVKLSLAEQGNQARQIADRLRIAPGDPDLTLSQDAHRLSGVEINALMDVVNDNVGMIEKYSRLLTSPDLRVSDEAKSQAASIMTALDAQNEDLLGRIVTARSAKGRDLGALRLLATRTNDPAVWMAKAKQILGPERPMTDAVRNRIMALANELKEKC